jgi:hypothetical protein
MLLNIKFILIFSATETFLIRRIQRDVIINLSTYYVKYRHSRHILTKLQFSQQIFGKYSNIKFHENPSSGSRVVPSGRTDGRTDSLDEANSRFSQFCERV